jgi:23S rRNA (cytosine1962-C5)-methyltransferase
MLLDTFKNFKDFELLDSGRGYRLERWGEVILQRPDPQIIWDRTLDDTLWNKAQAIFKLGGGEDKGRWEIKKALPSPWVIKFPIHPLSNTSTKGEGTDYVKLLLKLTPFKHTGIFAEQAANWEWMLEKITNDKKQVPNTGTDKKLKILNLFAYTGGATVVLAKAGCQVTHVDASKPSITWANGNHALNKLPKDSVRWILDDCAKFVKRELKRGAKYDGIIMDPPAFGHSPDGRTWKFNNDLPGLLSDCVNLLSVNAKFLIINGKIVLNQNQVK